MTAATSTALRVLVVEDESDLADLVRRFFEHAGHTVAVARDMIGALRSHRTQPVDVALIDLALPGSDGLALLRELRRDARPPVCIIITGNGTLERAMEATRLGAADFIAKPCDLFDLEMRVTVAHARAAAGLVTPPAGMRACDDGSTALRGGSGPIASTVARATQFAGDDRPVLVTGEVGAGQEALSRFIHANSARAAGPLVEACCEQFSKRGAGELFGTDGRAARQQRTVPLVALASGGTLVLLGIEALDAGAQAALARELKRAPTVHAVGAAPGEQGTRVVVTTSTDLKTAVRAGTVDCALAALLQDREVVLPPLRTRRDDIPVLAAAFVREFGGARPPVLADAAIAALKAHDWPRNVRELRQVIEQAVQSAAGGVIHARGLSIECGRGGTGGAGRPGESGGPGELGGTLSLAEMERRHIDAVLQNTDWHQGRAARLLGISAKTLYRKIRAYGFRRPDTVRGK